MYPDPRSRPGQIGRRLNSGKGMLRAAVIFITGLRVRRVHMIFPGKNRRFFPESKPLPARQAFLSVLLHSSGHAQHRLISAFGAKAISEQKGIASFLAKAGQPAVFILHSPEGDSGDVRKPFLFCPGEYGEHLPVACSQRFHGWTGRIRIMDVQLRNLHLEPQRAEYGNRLLIFL